ncbi:alkaline phosphatase family protein [Rhodobacteraceae bacterium]|nr:alkaline phosphatase family protein [Paracoccaceae bacterium]
MPHTSPPTQIGPFLYFRASDAAGVAVDAIVIRKDTTPPAPILIQDTSHAPHLLVQLPAHTVWRYRLTLPPEATGYRFDGDTYRVTAHHAGDLRIGFVSCNGEEHGDLTRPEPERNVMWHRLLEQHRKAPMALLVQGGDQIYADEVTDGHPLSENWPDDVPLDPGAEDLADLEAHLSRGFIDRYLTVLGAAAPARLMAEVPSLAIWDDHDICDGWGSLRQQATMSAVGQCLFRVARRFYLLFQHGAVEADVPDLFLDAQGYSLSWRHHLPGVTLLAPDLRSERRRRQVMGIPGWRAIDETRLAAGDHMILVSSVPLLGPRLSLVEGLMMSIPKMQKYEDDLRDQWQSRAHRAEWQRMLRRVLEWRKAGPVTVISGEIHLATRAEMKSAPGPVHQLVASGISHRAPSAGYARGLGLLAGLGEAPLADHPIRILPVPGQKRRYTAERNALVLERVDGTWSARWHLESSGITPPLELSDGAR